MVLSIAIDLKLTSGAIGSPNSLVRILLWLWLLFKRSLGVFSIRNCKTMGDLYYVPLLWYMIKAQPAKDIIHM